MSAYPSADPETLDTVRVEVEDRVATITIDRREKRNSLTEEVKDDLRGALGHVLHETDARAVVLTGAGDKSFVSGANIDDFEGRTPQDQRDVLAVPAIYEDVERFPLPVIAAINGFALGGGCEMALACDVRVACESARLGQPEINLGIIPGGGGTQRLRRLIGEGLTMDLVLTGRLVDAETAREYGMVDHVVPDDELYGKAEELAGMMAEKSPVALRYAKEAVLASSRQFLEEGRRTEVDLCSMCFSTEDQTEGVRAFLEKRDPVFEGR
ncbi:enoyl-CoA hydratase/isomerase family protein [Halomarina halobia]|uniref:Enoyl-CoA hydratase/isomerase family protein n=1 Tax=Halomarina halobia TaxID=3033386 RepID=A0ABD6AEC6_9EURY|nr:enoyl-CoA hydratase-related protein [Halomarina sp. PSR21]